MTLNDLYGLAGELDKTGVLVFWINRSFFFFFTSLNEFMFR
jgi:hypothetical protein